MRASVVHRAAAAMRQWLCIALVAIPFSSWADAASGLAWLQAQVQGAGQLASPSAAASDAQSQCEAARTLLELAVPAKAAQLTAALDASALAETVTEVLACTHWLQQQQGQIPRTSELQIRRTASSGFAAYEGQAGGSILDTGWALQALASQWSSAQAEPTLVWLQQQQAANGSFSVGAGAGSASDLLTTATVLRGLREHRQRSATAAAIADKAASYLLSQANAAGHWQSDPGITALVYEAVHPYSAAQPALAPAVKTWLLAGQGASGAWGNNDPWTTALVLRALTLTARPPVNPTQAALRLQLVDARTGNPIPAVQITAAGPAGSNPINTASDASGRVELTGLPPGAYTLTASAAGYSTLQTSATLRAGLVTDLGTLQMLVPGNSTTAVISGTVKDSASGEPLGAVTITVAAQSLGATTDAAGRYLISGVAPGNITIVASKSGYFDASGQASVLAAQTLDFSPSLVRNPAGGNGSGTPDCRILGTVTNASDGTPIAGAAISLSGANTSSASTDANGAYALTGLVSGDTRISVSLAGYDSAVANTRLHCNPQGNTAVQYSPRLYAGSQSPPDANTASLSGTVLDARTNQPIATAQLTFTTDTNIVRSTASQPDGRFTVTGLDGATVQLSVTATGYQSLTAGYMLQPGQNLELGQVRLRPPQAAELAVDLQVQAVKRHTLQTDPQTLRASGALQVQVRNAGTQPGPANMQILAFQDGNGNGQYDLGSDAVLGQVVLAAPLGAGQVQTLDIEVAGLLPFRDAPIHVVIDPLGTQAESNKANNVRSSAQDVLFVPQAGAFTPKLKWEWNGSGSSNPTSKQVMMAPIAIPTRDTNGDGKVDSQDVSDIVVVSYEGWYTNPSGTIRILSGVDGSEVRSIAARKVVNVGGLAAADLDGDGIPEIVATSSETGLPVAYRVSGEIYWSATNGDTGNFMPSNGGVWGSAFIADLDADGIPEVVMKGDVFNGRTGALLWSANGPYFGSTDSSYPRAYSLPVVADLFNTGKQNLILGASVYDHLGNLVWKNTQVGEGHIAIADFDSDGNPEIVHINRGRVSLMDRFGKLLWGPILVPNSDGVWGGPPTIADFDGDGVPEIGVSGRFSYTVLRADGSVLWWIPAKDYGSGMTGSTSFDFLGDGKAKVLYSDESSIFVLDGATGNQLIRLGSDSATTFEYPIVVDADRDGHAEFVTVRNEYGRHADADRGAGVRVYEDANGGWVPTRSIWNQHAYSITNINDDLSVPRNPEPSWKSHNTYRLNRRMDADPRAIADITASYVRVVDKGAQPGSQIIVRLGNAGSYKVPAGTPVAIYNTDPAQGQPAAQALVGQGVTQSVLPTGAYEDLAITPSVPLSQLSAMGTVWIVADDDGTGKHTLSDFDRSNNVALADLGAIATSLQIAVATDKPVYAETDTAIFTATVHNAGSFARNALVRLTVLDAAGQSVDVLPLGSAATMQPAADSLVQASWSVAAVLAGAYEIRAELVTPQGVVYGSASAPFSVKAASGAGAGDNSLNSARISTDRSRYNAAHTVFIDSRVANLSTNLLQENLRAVTQVIAPNGQVVLTRTEGIAQASPRSQRKYGYYLKASTLVPGTYQVRIQLFGSASYKKSGSAPQAKASLKADPADAELATSATSFVVQDAALGAGLAGQLSATPAAVAVGASTALQLNITNNGNAAIAGATVRVRVLAPASGTPVAVFTQSGVQLAVGASGAFSWNWTAAGAVGSTLPVAATVEIAGVEQPVAQAVVTLIGPGGGQPPLAPRPVPIDWQWLLALVILLPAIARLAGKTSGPRTHTNRQQQ